MSQHMPDRQHSWQCMPCCKLQGVAHVELVCKMTCAQVLWPSTARLHNDDNGCQIVPGVFAAHVAACVSARCTTGTALTAVPVLLITDTLLLPAFLQSETSVAEE